MMGIRIGFDRFEKEGFRTFAVCKDHAGKECRFEVSDDQVIRIGRWKEGELIQDALPDLTVEQREMLLSGMTQEDWDKMAKEEEE
jgi:hypothetical protein